MINRILAWLRNKESMVAEIDSLRAKLQAMESDYRVAKEQIAGLISYYGQEKRLAEEATYWRRMAEAAEYRVEVYEAAAKMVGVRFINSVP